MMLKLSELATREIYCQSHKNSLLVFGRWNSLTPIEYEQLSQKKSDILAQLDTTWYLPLPPWLNSMVVGELISESLSQYGLFYLAPDELVDDEARLFKLSHELYQTYPLLGSYVVWQDTGLALAFDDTLPPPAVNTLSIDFDDIESFIAHQLDYEHSVFNHGMLRIFRARCGQKMRWGIWLHHLVADADFVLQLLKVVQNLIKREIAPAVDYSFLQQIWRLNNRLSTQRTQLLVAWEEKRNWLSSAKAWSLDYENSTPVSFDVTLSGEENAFARAALKLAEAISCCEIEGPVLALTPVSLRYPMDYPVSGCYVTLIPLLLEAGCSISSFQKHHSDGLENALLPQEDITNQTGVDYSQARVMINLIENPLEFTPFIHQPHLRNRKAITLTLFKEKSGGWRGTLSSRLGLEIGQRLAKVFQEVQPK